jgi:hypothetical protein
MNLTDVISSLIVADIDRSTAFYVVFFAQRIE